MTTQGMYPLDPLTPSLLRQEPLFDGAPAPAGTLFVLGESGGYAAAPVEGRSLVLGRNSPDVHVTVGSLDWYVSREHATVRCVREGAGVSWLLRNGGRLPIRIPDVVAVLQQHEATLPPGYTPLYIQGTHLHVVEVLVSAGQRPGGPVRPETGTRELGLPVTDRERLVLVALLRYVLARADNAHPLSWKETSRVLNEVPGQRGWTERKAENVVDGIRHKLTGLGIAGLTTDTAAPEAIKGNLMRALLDSATLVPPDLRLLQSTVEGADS
ncbi:hypothetical protein [Amycolatopsis sp. GM8]|uniref:hypothetical protein n=1 Tax=Amycolatopsis sp. GM8 TaxID=2896530 RepID=UPI001F34648A|nr:hypothetical protein [Amycolatopsis sp. GM8]